MRNVRETSYNPALVPTFDPTTTYPRGDFRSALCCPAVRTALAGTFCTSTSSLIARTMPAASGVCGWYTVCMRRLRPSAASVPCTRSPREMPERRKVMRKCVLGSSSVDVDGGGGEARRAATVREAAVPLWTELRRGVLRKRGGRETLRKDIQTKAFICAIHQVIPSLKTLVQNTDKHIIESAHAHDHRCPVTFSCQPSNQE